MLVEREKGGRGILPYFSRRVTYGIEGLLKAGRKVQAGDRSTLL
jgi:hypothetical protein